MGSLEAHWGLAGKTAVIIGGSAGVGRGITLALAKAGVDIATCDIDEEATRAIVEETRALGRKILSLPADVRDEEALDHFYDCVEKEFEQVNIVINVAGGVTRMPFLKTTREQNATEIRLNFGYVVDSVRRAIPLLRRSGNGGSIINFTTIEAMRALRRQTTTSVALWRSSSHPRASASMSWHLTPPRRAQAPTRTQPSAQ